MLRGRVVLMVLMILMLMVLMRSVNAKNVKIPRNLIAVKMQESSSVVLSAILYNKQGRFDIVNVHRGCSYSHKLTQTMVHTGECLRARTRISTRVRGELKF